jgi:hypothetical protein
MPRKPNSESLERLGCHHYKSISVPVMAKIVSDCVGWYSHQLCGDSFQRAAAQAQVRLTSQLIAAWVAQRCHTGVNPDDVNQVLVLDQQYPQRSFAQWESNLRFLISKYKRSPK